MSTKQIATEPTADQTRHLVAACAEEIARHEDKFSGFGYTRGILGAALFNFYYGRYTQDDSYAKKAHAQVDEAILRVNDNSSTYFLDLTELGIFLEFVTEHQFSQAYDTNLFFVDVDKAIKKQIARNLASENAGGFTNGALSLGRYLLGRLRSTDAVVESLHELTEGLERLAVPTPNGIYWRSKLFTDERIYLTMPHGSAATILFLTRLWEEGLQTTRIHSLIEQGIAYLVSRRRDPLQYGSFFGDMVHLSEKPARLSLCYGDLGVGYSLLRASQTLQLDQHLPLALDILHFSANRRERPQTLLGDAGILYGASGLALTFDKVYRLTKNPVFAETSQYWLNQIPAWQTDYPDFLGFQSQYNSDMLNTGVSVYEGLAGIGLTLMQQQDPQLPSFSDLIWLL